ncbi:MAG TPA: hypothetical protein HA346_06205 [Thermoplasmata archaeon]|jgi:hypothetical protein|nr:hypothetical protein [Thermoplasmata archaeon]HIH98574.1 hypothetical protein [Thermoplasmata archaeon]
MEEESKVEKNMKKAAQLLFFRRHRLPGVRGWELKRAIGGDWLEVIKLLNLELERLGIEVKQISETGEENEEDPEGARFVALLKTPLPPKATGRRIDDIAILSATLAFLISKQGKASKKEIEELLSEKFPRWRVGPSIDRYLKDGYLGEDEKMIYIGWRTRAEVDKKTLLDLILAS